MEGRGPAVHERQACAPQAGLPQSPGRCARPGRCASAFPPGSYPRRADGGEAAAPPSHRPAPQPHGPWLSFLRRTSSPHTAFHFFISSLPSSLPDSLVCGSPGGSPGVRPCPGSSSIFASAAARERTTGRSALPHGAAGGGSGGQALVTLPVCALRPPPPHRDLQSPRCSSPWGLWV